MRTIVAVLAGVGILASPPPSAGGPAPLLLESKIPLGDVKGRLDHFALDSRRQRLFVAELGNNSVGVIDLTTRKVIHTIKGLREPQGIGHVASSDTVYVANAGDGSVDLFRGADLTPQGRIELGKDADNIRVAAETDRVLVGYGEGAIAVIDSSSRKKLHDLPLAAHPESFQLDGMGTRLFVNIPEARQIAVLDLPAGRQIGTLPTSNARGNFPMAIDDEAMRVIVGFRVPPKLAVFGAGGGNVIAAVATCGDADDIVVDAKRHRLYVSCGTGIVDVLAQHGATYERIASVPTAPGARTSLLAPALDRLFVAVPAGVSGPAAVWVFRPQP